MQANIFDDIFEDMPDNMLNPYVSRNNSWNAPLGDAARQSPEQAPAAMKYLSLAQAHGFQAEPDMMQKQKISKPSGPSTGSSSEPEPDMEKQVSPKGSVGEPCEEMFEEADFYGARPGEMLPPQWPSRNVSKDMQRQITNEMQRQITSEMQRQITSEMVRQVTSDMVRQVTEETWAMWGNPLHAFGQEQSSDALLLGRQDRSMYMPDFAMKDLPMPPPMVPPQDFSMLPPFDMVPPMQRFSFPPVGMPEDGAYQVVGEKTHAIPVPDDWAEVYTIMMRNLPNKYTQQQLIEEINNKGFLGTYDFLYLPIDPDTNVNRGYAFVNFCHPSNAVQFKAEFDGRQMALFDSSKFVTVTPATLQGFDANYAHYANARVNRGDPKKRPLFLREPIINAGKSRRGGRRHGKSMIDVALRAKQRESVMAAQAPMEATPCAPHVVLPPSAGEAAEMSTSSRRYCPACGGSSRAGDKFCTFCGSSLSCEVHA
eukprot:gnl/TRDRNA2_/TRDRNA2_153336_c1_seq4.p1 gnl/TRDRNA2_/TRDRNA2_153336_c1~~gnl/TRDRNA2_/TRDRNA2_153336_c1_seq4.p1  ORF type:complete len:499 (-),score=89.05 gnl/TRDRNA2_/TRDRNA2_153336_c1_seq4:236-1681(-)